MAEIVMMGTPVLHTEYEFTCGDCNGRANGMEDVSLVEGEPFRIFLSAIQMFCPHCGRTAIVLQVVNEPLELTMQAQTEPKGIVH